MITEHLEKSDALKLFLQSEQQLALVFLVTLPPSTENCLGLGLPEVDPGRHNISSQGFKLGENVMMQNLLRRQRKSMSFMNKA